jgi:hypothetical protein
MEGVDDRIHLDPIACRQQHRLADVAGEEYLVEQLRHVMLSDGGPLQHLDRGGVVRQPHHEHGHDPTPTR